MKWHGPITFDEPWNQVVAARPKMPPVADRVYVISLKPLKVG